MEIGVSTQPFLQSFDQYGSRATDGFCKCLWEKLNIFWLRLVLDHQQFKPPREHDQWIMTFFRSLGYSLEECGRLNRVRLHQQVLYDSNVFNADGTTIDKQYLSPWNRGDKWSPYRFGLQKPPPRDFSLWKEALTQLAPGGRRQTRLGKFLFPGHKIWHWRYDPTNEHIFLLTDGTKKKYSRSKHPQGGHAKAVSHMPETQYRTHHTFLSAQSKHMIPPE